MTQCEIDILKETFNFSFNWDLGALQHRTGAYIEILRALRASKQITQEQYNELHQLLIDHFTNALQTVIKNPIIYLV